MTGRPELRDFGGLTAGDFERHPVWVNCHGLDEDEPWYDDTDEETFRPYDGALPVDPSEGMYLVAAIVVLADGTHVPGFVTPMTGGADPGRMQPYVFAGDAMYGFWGGMFGVAEARRKALHAALGKAPSDVLPVQVSAQPGLTTGTSDLVVHDWGEAER